MDIKYDFMCSSRSDRREDFLVGQGVTSPWYVGTTTVRLIDRFPERVVDTPVYQEVYDEVPSYLYL